MRATMLFLLALTVTGCNIATDFDDLYEPRSYVTGGDAAGCPNHWAGLDCDQCPGNWDESQDCSACRNQWTGEDCEICPDNWGGADCDACAGNWDLSASCTTCLPGWADVNGDDCGTCVRFVATTGSPAGDAMTWGSATDAIQSAVVSAGQAMQATCHVWVQQGTYSPTLGTGNTARFALEDGIELYGGFAADALTWETRDPAAHVTTLEGQGPAHPYHVVTAAGDTVLDGFTITGGYAMGTLPGSGEGAGLLVQDQDQDQDVTINVNNCVFTGNQTRRGGGAVYVHGNGSATFANCTFDANVSGDNGGAIWINGGTVEASGCTFDDNAALYSEDGDGGAIHAGQGAHLTVTGSSFTGNSSGNGGAISVSASVVSIDTSELVGNEAVGFDPDGGGLYVDGGTATVTRTLFSGNTGLNSGLGGAVHVAAGSVSFTNSVFSGNQTDGSGNPPEGGAIYMAGGTVTLFNCTMHGNSVAGSDENSTGGAIYVSGGTAVGTNTIVWGNSPHGVTNSSGVIDTWATFSDLQDGAGPPENNNKSIDPEFVGSTPYDLHLQEGSDCINAGTPAGAPADDFDGLPRVGQPDMGAYEYR